MNQSPVLTDRVGAGFFVAKKYAKENRLPV